jgi:tRNA(Ile)-lysidine synthase
VGSCRARSSSDLEEYLLLCLDRYGRTIGGRKFAVAVSGGCDSLCLAIIAKKWADINGASVLALTVDHGLREESSKEAVYVHKLCERYAIEHRVLVWTGEKPTTNVESRAREARYGLISNFCRDNSIEHLLVAHHREDQAETFFLRLFRGSGIDGLSSMGEVTNIFGLEIIRPFLNVHKSCLEQYLLDNSVVWIKDPSNDDQRFLRNRIRHFLNSFDNREEITDRVSFAVGEISKLKKDIEERTAKIQSRALDFSGFGTCLIRRDVLFGENLDIILRILAHVAMKIAGNRYRPRLVKLKRLLDHLAGSLSTSRYTFYGCIFEDYGDDYILAYREHNSISADEELAVAREVVWDSRFRVLLTRNIGTVFVTHVREGELNALAREARSADLPIYKALEDLKNVEKRVFYTLPVLRINGRYSLDCPWVRMGAL